MESGPALLAAFVERAPYPVNRPAEVQAALEAKLSAAQRAWPAIELAPTTFMACLAERLRANDDVLAELTALREVDLWLSCATVTGVPHALETFERTVMSRVPAFVARIDASLHFADEVVQTMRVKLLVGPDGGPGKLSQYSGRGSLESWVCAVATRLAVDLVRGRKPVDGSDSSLDVLPATDDPELEVLRVQHREAFAGALADALAALEPRQRTLLRLYFLEKVTYQALGRVYQVHETTAMRWVEQAKMAVVTGVQAALRKRLNLSESEFDSLAQLMQSQLDISIGRLLSSRHASQEG